MIGVSIKVCAYIIDCDWKYLFQKRDNHMYDGSGNKITLFGGWVDTGETILDGLVRELYEELELRVELCTIVFVWRHTSSTGVCFEIFEVSMTSPQEVYLHEWADIVYVKKDMLYDPSFCLWFKKIHAVYLSWLWEKN